MIQNQSPGPRTSPATPARCCTASRRTHRLRRSRVGPLEPRRDRAESRTEKGQTALHHDRRDHRERRVWEHGADSEDTEMQLASPNAQEPPLGGNGSRPLWLGLGGAGK